MLPLDLYKSYLPNSLLGDENDSFFDFIGNMLFGYTSLHTAYEQALPLLALVQSEGGWLDIIGAWIGLKRPNTAVRPLEDGEVLFQKIGPTDPPFNALHSLSTDNPAQPGAVSNTFFASIIGAPEGLMIDDEYRELLIAYQNLKFNGDTLPNVLRVLSALLSQPFELTSLLPGQQLIFTVAEKEAFGRIVAVQQLFDAISGDGILYVVST